MKSSAILECFFFCHVICSGRRLLLGPSRKTHVLSDSLRCKILPVKAPLEIDINELASSGRELSGFLLNEAMKCMGGDISGCKKAHLLDENEIIMSKSYEGVVDYAMAYGLTEVLCGILFRYGGWETEFGRHVYAARLYRRGWCPLGEWQDQLGLDWDANYQAIFKADNPMLLRDMLLDDDRIFQEGRNSIFWRRLTEGTVDFIKKYFARLILYYDSARILEAFCNFEFDDPDNFLPLCESIQDTLEHDNDGGLGVMGYNWKLRIFFGMSVDAEIVPTYDQIEYAIGWGPFKLEENPVFSLIIRHDLDWALGILYSRNLLTFVHEECIEEVIKKGRYKILAWIYDRSYDPLYIPQEKLEEWISVSPFRHRHEILKVYKGAFTEYLPTQFFVDNNAQDAGFLDFLESLSPPMYPSKERVCHWGNLDLRLRVYKANPDWIITDDEIKMAEDKRGGVAFVEYALGRRKGGTISCARSLQLIRYNAEVDANYIPNWNELEHAYRRDDIGLISWLFGQERFKELFGGCTNSLFNRFGMSFKLAKWLWEERKIKLSEARLETLVESGNLEACKWALLNFEDEVRWLKGKRLKGKQLKGKQLKTFRRETIEWWLENIDREYVLDVKSAFEWCARQGNVESARWIVENWSLNLSQREMWIIYNYDIFQCSRKVQLDFIELLYMNNEQIPAKNSLNRLNQMAIRSRPNLKRIMAEHVHRRITLKEWEFILNLPDLYGGINLRALKKMMFNGDNEIVGLLGRYGHLDGYGERIGVIKAGIGVIIGRAIRTIFERFPIIRLICICLKMYLFAIPIE